MNPMPTVAANPSCVNLPVSNWTSSEVLPTPLSPTRIVCRRNNNRHQVAASKPFVTSLTRHALRASIITHMGRHRHHRSPMAPMITNDHQSMVKGMGLSSDEERSSIRHSVPVISASWKVTGPELGRTAHTQILPLNHREIRLTSIHLHLTYKHTELNGGYLHHAMCSSVEMAWPMTLSIVWPLSGAS